MTYLSNTIFRGIGEMVLKAALLQEILRLVEKLLFHKVRAELFLRNNQDIVEH